jgi:hypothetical protein
MIQDRYPVAEDYRNGDAGRQSQSEAVRLLTAFLIHRGQYSLRQNAFRPRFPHITSAASLPGVRLVSIRAPKSCNMNRRVPIRSPRAMIHVVIRNTVNTLTMSLSLLQR